MDGNFSPEMPREDCFASIVSTKAVFLGFILAQVQNLNALLVTLAMPSSPLLHARRSMLLLAQNLVHLKVRS